MIRRAIGALLLGSLIGCTTIQLVSKYDENTDKEASALQKQISEFVIKQQSTDDVTDRSFAKNQKFYQDATASLNSLQVRAGGIYKNKLTIDQLQLAEDNMAYLSLLHKNCVTGPLSEAQKSAVREAGVDTSLTCRVQYGANADIADRGSQTLNVFLLKPIASIFEQSFGSIIALELAKKRGEGEKK